MSKTTAIAHLSPSPSIPDSTWKKEVKEDLQGKGHMIRERLNRQVWLGSGRVTPGHKKNR